MTSEDHEKGGHLSSTLQKTAVTWQILSSMDSDPERKKSCPCEKVNKNPCDTKNSV